LFPVDQCSTETSTLNRSLVQPACCEQQPKSSQPHALGNDVSPFVPRTALRPRSASVCPLDHFVLIALMPSFCAPYSPTLSPSRTPALSPPHALPLKGTRTNGTLAPPPRASTPPREHLLPLAAAATSPEPGYAHARLTVITPQSGPMSRRAGSTYRSTPRMRP